jgi:hypothetical protein
MTKKFQFVIKETINVEGANFKHPSNLVHQWIVPTTNQSVIKRLEVRNNHNDSEKELRESIFEYLKWINDQV